jgi:hypothetical protein
MNAILLGAASLGALAVFLTAPPEVRVSSSEDRGWMTRDVQTNPDTGETEETNVIAFLD